MLSVAAFAELSLQLSEDIKFRVGGDVRARYEGYGFNVVAPNAPKDHRHTTEYLRVRTRLYGAFDFGEDMTINLRLANRFHYVTTSPSKRNNDGASTWEFPDEVYVDSANVVFKNLVDGKLSITLGRQDMMLGNGLLISEGTPFDQGRSVYFDGISARYKDDTETVTAFVFYDSWKDRYVFINDRNRTLRCGDIFTAGLYWTHSFGKAINLDTYYMFNDVDDRHPDTVDRCYHDADSSVSLHTAGFRLFGTAPDWLDYSLEAARQFGRKAGGEHIGGEMADARLNIHLCDETTFKPMLGLEIAHFSGDDGGKGRDRYWNPMLCQCPLWGEELMPIMLNSIWSNLNMLGTKMSCNLTENCKLSFYATEFFLDDRDGIVGSDTNVKDDGSHIRHDRHVGLLVGTCAAYSFNQYLSCQAWLSHFMPGNYFNNGHDSNWFRVEVTLAF